MDLFKHLNYRLLVQNNKLQKDINNKKLKAFLFYLSKLSKKVLFFKFLLKLIFMFSLGLIVFVTF